MGPGRLVFKGENPKKKKKKSKHTHKEDGAAADAVSSSREVAHLAPPPQSSSVQEPPPSKPSSSSVVVAPQRGTGHITTSGTVVTGHGGTQFEREISPGDAIIVMVNETQQEMRVVTMRLSNVSLNLSSPFSHNIKEPTAFSIIRKPRDETKLRKLAAQQHQMSQKEEEEKASGTFGATDELVYREKTEHGSYRIKRVKVEAGQQVSRADLLHMRAKKTSDKYC